MTRFVLCAALALMSVPAIAQQQQSQPDPKYILAPLQAQRDSNANAAVLCEANSAALKERIAELEAKLKEAQPKE